MPDQTSTIISKVWGMCGPLRDDGVSYGDYLEQLTYLIFLKMSDEYSKPPHQRETGIPAGCGWSDMNTLKGAELESKYKSGDRHPRRLRLVGYEHLERRGTGEQVQIHPGDTGGAGGHPGQDLSGGGQQDQQRRHSLPHRPDDRQGKLGIYVHRREGRDLRGPAAKERRGREKRCGPVLHAPAADPGHGGVHPTGTQENHRRPLLRQRRLSAGGPKLPVRPQAYTLDREAKEFLKRDTFRGWEIVPTTFKMSLMNLFLHNIGDLYGEVPITLGDALLTDPGERFDYVLTNPPFGKKSSLTFTNEEGEQEEEDLVYNRQDFWTTSSNKQLIFLQHINTLLKADGKAAVVVPDNVLFEGGAGETIRKKLLETCDLHTILRLPTGIFYKPGVKANVIFFDKRPASPERQTKEVWFYDLRTNLHFTLKQHPMTYEDLKDFIQCYHPENRYERHETWSQDNPDGRWRRFTAEEILNRDKTSLDIFWIKDKALADLDNLPAPEELAEDILENLQSAMDGFSELLAALKQ